MPAGRPAEPKGPATERARRRASCVILCPLPPPSGAGLVSFIVAAALRRQLRGEMRRPTVMRRLRYATSCDKRNDRSDKGFDRSRARRCSPRGSGPSPSVPDGGEAVHAHGTPVVIYREGARAGDASTFGELPLTASVLRWWLPGRIFCAYQAVDEFG